MKMLVRNLIVLWIVVVIVVGVGWVKNIVKLVECDFEPSYKAEVIHIIGIIPPVGMITGWMDFGK